MKSDRQKILNLKTRLRQKMRGLKLSAKIRLSRSAKLCVEINKSRFFKDAQSIGFYAALPDEIDVLSAAKTALQLGKKVYFPRVSGKKIEFREVHNLEKDLKPGRFGILEPVAKTTKKRTRPLDLMIIPGRAFDKKGGRLGRGVGYYDRLFEKWDCSVRMGVGFREQRVASVPCEPHDVTMDVVLTA